MKVIQISWRRYMVPPLHEEGPRFLAIFLVLTVLLAWIWLPLVVVGALLTVWCFFFFRDPVRYVPTRPGLVVTPASGVVQMIGPSVPPPELEMGEQPLTRISVFMSVFDCHVNRIPVGGEIVKEVYRPGKFLDASLDKASEQNERQSVRLRTDDGREIAFVQIAGLLARRIRCDIKAGQRLATGDRFGLIRFGSRVDIYLPPGTNPLVVLGQNCVSGETILADLTSDEAERDGKGI
ncbi:phosphatidylserine decarboxylase [Insolitispirillum peregrinum]|uniref:Phosphatidylserine decarboxylase proenzyme n=1 Tax=Insolitispirillum peregrinum TaxID=80876 RepID=A0A1N7Q5W5_9PROT|nr:phosphatidylserine decarboxylase [Insolitispirillum peregrinum]SIT18231.1 phosphatidylserine decarboxylase [Insolitispirillum peregrinum]